MPPMAAAPRPVLGSGVVLAEDPSDEELARKLDAFRVRPARCCCAGARKTGSALRCSSVCCVGLGGCWNRRNRRPFASFGLVGGICGFNRQFRTAAERGLHTASGPSAVVGVCLCLA